MSQEIDRDTHYVFGTAAAPVQLLALADGGGVVTSTDALNFISNGRDPVTLFISIDNGGTLTTAADWTLQHTIGDDASWRDSAGPFAGDLVDASGGEWAYTITGRATYRLQITSPVGDTATIYAAFVRGER